MIECDICNNIVDDELICERCSSPVLVICRDCCTCSITNYELGITNEVTNYELTESLTDEIPF